MVKPDGTESHEHSINDFTSNNVIIAGGDMIITGIGNIYENAELKYRDVPITVHLMGKQHVLGLILDTVKTDRHFVSNHEMFGTDFDSHRFTRGSGRVFLSIPICFLIRSLNSTSDIFFLASNSMAASFPTTYHTKLMLTYLV
jgi:hypothetical protein